MKINRLIISIIALTIMSCASEKDSLVTIKTKFGDMKVILFDETPLHKESFLELANNGSYDSTIFHRVIAEFMVQGGDINRKEGAQNNTLIPAEIRSDLIHTKGMLAAARTGDNVNPERKSGTQFYIVQGKKYSKAELQKMADDEYMAACINGLQQLFAQNRYRDLMTELINYQNSGDQENFTKRVLESAEIVNREGGNVKRKVYSDSQYQDYATVGGAPFLDGSYTVFGKVLEGVEVVDSIAAQQTDPRDQPIEDIFMTMQVEEMPKSKISKTYNYSYPDSE